MDSNMLLIFSCLWLLLAPNTLATYPFQNISLPFDKRVEDIVNRLSLSELVGQMARGGAKLNGPAPAISELGIKPYQWGTECLSGDVSAGPATSFPMPIGMAASFNYDLVYFVSNATSCEVKAKNIDATSKGSYAFHTGLSCWSPVINIMRDPRWGRNQETFGEDPWLSGQMARAFVTGLQGDDQKYVRVNAGCKHFNVHGGPENIPVSRFSFDAKVSDRDWRMTFLPAFKKCVEAGSWSLMCSYNSINGVPACANSKLLTDILRKEWNFKGYVISDQEALEFIRYGHHYTNSLVNASAVAANAGTCLEDTTFSEKIGNAFANLEEAVNKGLVDISVLKDAVSRLFMVRMKLGEFDPLKLNPYSNLTMDLIQSEAHRNLSLRAALESGVLLKHTSLPITSSKTICVIGPFINEGKLLYGDYSPDPMNEYIVTVLDGIKKYYSSATITSATGCTDGPKCKSYDSGLITKACTGVDTIIITAGLSTDLEGEGNDRADIVLPGSQLQMMQDAVKASSTAKAVLVLFNADPLDVSWAVQNNQIGDILELFYPAQSAGDALGMILTGSYSPAGRLPCTWPTDLSKIPAITNYTMHERTYRYYTGTPLFPFGYGLSYSKFNYSNLTLSTQQIKPGDKIIISVTVHNTGSMDSDEVTQVYLKWDRSVMEAPLKQLVGVQRTHLKKGDSQTILFNITSDLMQVWTTEWVIKECTMTVTVGGQQPDQTVTVDSNILTATFVIQK